jgi:hypothetical protein
MQGSDISKFIAMMAGIAELYGKCISAQLTDIYWRALKHYELQDVQRALEAHVNNPDCGQFFPKPADVVRFIDGSGETKALLAWTKVEQAIVGVGKYESVAFDDPLIHAVLEDMGGWINLCSKTNDEMPFSANEFRKRYMGFVNKKPERHPRYLPGISEIENGKSGYAVSPPALVGDAKRAEQVIVTGGGTPLLIHHPGQQNHDLVKQLLESIIPENCG